MFISFNICLVSTYLFEEEKIINNNDFNWDVSILDNRI